ncbi:MAG: hypothetical protein HYU99_02235 [Deltaproteobacteria bacterium]|nr:hypothetical protein [Deltaproteobacteria bacterium]
MNKKMLGTIVATAVAGFIFTANCMAEETTTSTTTAKVKCSGMNECKGKGMCKGMDNACKGQNGCKGKGWMEMDTEKDCTDKKGTVVKEEAK